MKTLITLLIIFTLVSCGSKKKLVEKEIIKTETDIQKDTFIKTHVDIKTIEKTGSKSEVDKTTDEDNFTGDIEDPTLPASVTVEEKDGKKVTTYHNFKKVQQTALKTTEKVTDTFGQYLSRTDLSKIDLTQKEQMHEKTEAKTIKKDLEVKRGFPWWILILLLVVYGVVSYFRGLNPLKWVSK